MMNRRSLIGGGAGALALTMLGPAPVFAVSVNAWARLRRHLTGRLVLPADEAYLTAKQLAYLQFTTDPKAIAYCADAADVALCLAFAQDQCLPFAVRSGGHSFGGYSTSKGLVIDVSGLNRVSLDASGVAIGPGAQLVDIAGTLSASGMAISGGLHPTTAAGGFLQGGGIGLLTRSVGIASDKVTSATVVLANGRTVTASASQNPDLFWAIRGGGGGNFGVVTEFKVTPTPITLVTVATLSWTYDRAVDVLDGYARWLEAAPRTIGGGARILLPDAAPGATPAPVVVLGSVGTRVELEAEIARLSALTGAPVFSQINTLPYAIFQMAVFGCATNTVPQCHLVGSNADGVLPRIGFGLQRSRLFSAAPARSVWEGALALFDTARTAGQAHNLEVLAMGGAANDLARTATAFVHRNTLFTADFLVQSAGPASAAQRAVGQAFVNAGFQAIDAASSGETYQNFVDPALPDWRRSYYAENYPRLARIKRAADPHGVFDFAQSIGS
jgi:FAD/FMN-containing dehydrogenase